MLGGQPQERSSADNEGTTRSTSSCGRATRRSAPRGSGQCSAVSRVASRALWWMNMRCAWRQRHNWRLKRQQRRQQRRQRRREREPLALRAAPWSVWSLAGEPCGPRPAPRGVRPTISCEYE